jgi:hypothetical protein
MYEDVKQLESKQSIYKMTQESRSSHCIIALIL